MKAILTGTAAALVICQPGFADVVGFENFDGGAVNLSGNVNVFDYNAGGGSGGDVFGRVDLSTGMPFDVADDSVFDVSGGGAGSPFPGDMLGIAGQNTSGFFAMNDMDGSGMPQVFDFATWSFDISSAQSITNVMIDLAAMGDFEASSTDGFMIEAQVDGGGYVEIFRARANEDIDAQPYRALDLGTLVTLNDPLELFIDGSGTAAAILDKSDPGTGAFDTFTSTAMAGLSGSIMDIRVSWAGTPSGSEPMGIDNIMINGIVPAPGALALLGLAGFTVRRRRR